MISDDVKAVKSLFDDWPEELLRKILPPGRSLEDVCHTLASQMQAVLKANPKLHLTTITDSLQFIDRHIHESLLGARLVAEATLNSVMAKKEPTALLDFGSGNGYPGVPCALLTPHLQPYLIEAAQKKAQFLENLKTLNGLESIEVIARQVQRPADLPDSIKSVGLIVTRAMGNWERVIPRFHSILSPHAQVLIWSSQASAGVFERQDWKRRFELQQVFPIPSREQSCIYALTQKSVST